MVARTPEKNRKPTRKTAHARLLREHRHLYDDLLALQGGHCALCPRGPSKSRRLDLDHDHRTMVVRGLLCPVCNKNLSPSFGTEKDVDADWHRRVAQYLDHPPMRALALALAHVEKKEAA